MKTKRNAASYVFLPLLFLPLLGATCKQSESGGAANWFALVLEGKTPAGNQLSSADPSKAGNFGNFTYGMNGASKAYKGDMGAVALYGSPPWMLEIRFNSPSSKSIRDTLSAHSIPTSGMKEIPILNEFGKSFEAIESLAGLPEGWGALAPSKDSLLLLAPEWRTRMDSAAQPADPVAWPAKAGVSDWLGRSLEMLEALLKRKASHIKFTSTRRNLPKGFGYGQRALSFYFHLGGSVDWLIVSYAIPTAETVEAAHAEVLKATPIEYVFRSSSRAYDTVSMNRQGSPRFLANVSELRRMCAAVGLKAERATMTNAESANVFKVGGLQGVGSDWEITTYGSDLTFTRRGTK